MSCPYRSGNPCQYTWPASWGENYQPGRCYYCNEPPTDKENPHQNGNSSEGKENQEDARLNTKTTRGGRR